MQKILLVSDNLVKKDDPSVQYKHNNSTKPIVKQLFYIYKKKLNPGIQLNFLLVNLKYSM